MGKQKVTRTTHVFGTVTTELSYVISLVAPKVRHSPAYAYFSPQTKSFASLTSNEETNDLK